MFRFDCLKIEAGHNVPVSMSGPEMSLGSAVTHPGQHCNKLFFSAKNYLFFQFLWAKLADLYLIDKKLQFNFCSLGLESDEIKIDS